MKNIIATLCLISICIACTKTNIPVSVSGSTNGWPTYTEKEKEDITNYSAVCTSVKTKGKTIRYGTTRLVHSNNNKETKIEYTHIPAHVQVSYTEEGNKIYPNIWLEDAFDEKGEDIYVEYTIEYEKSTLKYRIKLKRPTLTVKIPYVHEQDSVFVLSTDYFYERPSHKTNSWMDTYRGRYEFDASSNTEWSVSSTADWIKVEIDYPNRITFKPNETNENRVGYVTFTEATGELSKTIKFTQERADYREYEADILMQFYEAMGGENWKYKWDKETNTFPGVTYSSDGHVTRIIASNNNLTGQIPDCIGELWHLYEIDLHNNHITGPLPKTLGKLGTCDVLDLSNNEITGNLPEELMLMSSLRKIYLNNNKMSGAIPSWFPTGLERYPYQTQYMPVDYCLANNYWTNFDNDKHCSHKNKHHDWQEYNGGFVPGGEIHETF